MDDFRKQQKAKCFDGSSSQVSRYGCVCCRCISSLNKFKKWSRKHARVTLKESDKKEEQNIADVQQNWIMHLTQDQDFPKKKMWVRIPPRSLEEYERLEKEK